ncbi:MAG: glycoside hydrolase family 35 protein [Clostridia bacterium]
MLEIRGREFYLDGKKFNIYSGAIHYFRVPHEYWRDRLLKLKAAGFNTVETYVAWNMHQPEENCWRFEGQADVIRFIQTAQEVGLYAIVRPGPYICAEWDFGGLPAWLLRHEQIRLRCYDKPYITYVQKYFDVLLPKLARLQVTRGGPILAMQIENEYGSYGRDKKYLGFLRDLIRKNGIDVLLFTSDGESRYHLSGGGLDGEMKVVNFGGYPANGFRDLKEFQPDRPLLCGEMWCGWFDHFRERHHHSPSAWSKKTYRRILEQFFREDANFNFYMFHGGTNFGYMAGANYAQYYQPTTTSYDYDAPLNEYGDYTAKYYVMRDALCKRQGIATPELPPRPQTQALGKVELTQCTSLFRNMEALSVHHADHIAHYMEYYGQSHGLILYHTEIEGDYPDTSISADGVHDVAWVFVNHQLVGRYDRSRPLTRRQVKNGVQPSESFTFPIPAFRGKITVDILVEGMGRINFDKRLADRKGLAAVRIGEQYVYDFDIYTIAAERVSALDFTAGETVGPVYLKGKFSAPSRSDCFVKITNLTKGYVFVNGINLGRYWDVGPQRTLYLPGVWLKAENEIVILELEKCKKTFVEIVDHPIFS